MARHRYLEPQVLHDLEQKMVFVSGPRQVGKTTLAKNLPGSGEGYLNWDVAEHRERILARELPPSRLLIFDEIHKYRGWRDYLKGLFDSRRKSQRILVTGSARLDVYRFSGDSLQGRYHMLRLHPFSTAELGIQTEDEFNQLLELGGFPEPFLAGSAVDARRWSREYRNLLIREEITSLENVQDLGNLELLVMRLPALVGSPLSINALREELRVSQKTVDKWIQILERLYAIFRLMPFGTPAIRAIQKAQKHYHFDWSLVKDEGPRFENFVASHLLKHVHYRQDTRGLDVELRYFRTRDGREVDFVITEDGDPRLAVECKLSPGKPSAGLRYLRDKFPDCDAWQVSTSSAKDYVTRDGIRVCHALQLLKNLV